MMNQFLVVHDYGYPALYMKLENGFAGNKRVTIYLLSC